MKELTKFLRYLLISNLLFLSSCDYGGDDVRSGEIPSEISTPLTRNDSILQLAEELDIAYDLENENIHVVLDKIIAKKHDLITKLDSLDERADQMESLAYQYKKKEDTRLKNELLSEIAKIKSELTRIKLLSEVDNDKIVKKDSFAIPEIKVPENTSTFEELPAGNYITRLDKYHVISVRVTDDGEIFMGKPRKDSITVISGGKKLSPRVNKELDQIRKKMN